MTPPLPPHQHGVKGVYYGGSWLDIEDCDGLFTGIEPNCSGCTHAAAGSSKDCSSKHRPAPCPRSRSRNSDTDGAASCASASDSYDILIIGAGCIGAAIARELSRYKDISILWVDAADDVSQGATKGNSGIVHAGYDDKPNTNRSKFCWKGNQMFPQLDRELRFGYQLNGSLVLAKTQPEVQILHDLIQRGETNGVQNLRIVQQDELRQLEPAVHPEAIAALYAPDAGNVIPYEYAIALAENAVDNGVELRIRREVTGITNLKQSQDEDVFAVTMRHWEPRQYVDATTTTRFNGSAQSWLLLMGIVVSSLAMSFMGVQVVFDDESLDESSRQYSALATSAVVVATALLGYKKWNKAGESLSSSYNMAQLVQHAGRPEGGSSSNGTRNNVQRVQVHDMLVGGSGASRIVKGVTVETEVVKARYIINCAGGASDKVARMIGDDSFTIKPRLGDYLLLNRNQGHLAKHTLFPTPDPVLGKGVLVQTTLWGNLILGPTARDTYKPEARDMTHASVQQYILSKCKRLVPSFDPKETIHAFCGARAKSDRGDWIIESSAKNGHFFHVAGIDSPGLAGSPAIALEVVRLLQEAGLMTIKDPSFNPNRAPIITPKRGMRGLKMGPVGKNDSADGMDESKMASNVICKCEKVTELEVIRAMRRSLPIDSSQAIRKRTRAGMGNCQGDPDNYSCEGRVRAIIARENGVPVTQVGGRPWPATSTLTQRWIDEGEKEKLKQRMGE